MTDTPTPPNDHVQYLKTFAATPIWVDIYSGKFSAAYFDGEALEWHESQSLETLEDNIVKGTTPEGKVEVMDRPKSDTLVPRRLERRGRDAWVLAPSLVKTVIRFVANRSRYGATGDVRLVAQGDKWVTDDYASLVVPDEALIAEWNSMLPEYEAVLETWRARFDAQAARFQAITPQEIRAIMEEQVRTGQYRPTATVLREVRAARKAAQAIA